MYNENKNSKAENKSTSEYRKQDCKHDGKHDKLIAHNDLFRKYIHDIRNMKTLDNEMINNIRIMSNEDKMDIIIAFNNVVEYVNALLIDYPEK